MLSHEDDENQRQKVNLKENGKNKQFNVGMFSFAPDFLMKKQSNALSMRFLPNIRDLIIELFLPLSRTF